MNFGFISAPSPRRSEDPCAPERIYCSERRIRPHTASRAILLILSLIFLTVSVTPAPLPLTSFSRTDFSVGDIPDSVVVGDFNADGNLDLAVANTGTASISVLIGDGSGDFDPANFIPTAFAPTELTTGDFNSDDILDIAAALPAGQQVFIQFGGDLTSRTTIGPLSCGEPLDLTAGDFNCDGKADLTIISPGSNVLSLLPGNGDGTFGPCAFAGTVRDDPQSIIAADFNSDGKPDVSTANLDFFSGSVALGNCMGTFGPDEDILTGSVSFGLAVGDFNGDNRLDLAITNRDRASVSIVPGNGDGTFGPARELPTGTLPLSVAAGDFNGDGFIDLAVADSGSNTASILFGVGDGSFVDRLDLVTGERPTSVAVGDLNRDGAVDLAVTNADSDSISVFLNQARFAITGASVDRPVLWPPNHRMVDVDVSYEVEGGCPPVDCSLSVTSSEPVNGKGDGNTSPDWEIVDAHRVRLRAERAGGGPGRVYTVTINCRDRCGNSESERLSVLVPGNRRN